MPDECQHNGHMYYVLLAPGIDRQKTLNEFKSKNILPVFHYVPLHSSPAGKRFTKTHGNLSITDDYSDRLIRLPLWVGIDEAQQTKVVEVLKQAN